MIPSIVMKNSLVSSSRRVPLVVHRAATARHYNNTPPPPPPPPPASNYMGNNESLRSYPQYNVWGEYCMLSVKILLPAFRMMRNNVLALDSNKKGRILLEWTPRSPGDGSFARDNKVVMGLSPEEVGLFLDQLPQHEVELVRRMPPSGGDYNMPGTVVSDAPEKVMRVIPSNGGVVSFQVQSESEGSGGSNDGKQSLAVDVQLGEFQVIREIMRTSIPSLVGWTTQLEIANQRNLEEAQKQGGVAASSSYGSPAESRVPF